MKKSPALFPVIRKHNKILTAGILGLLGVSSVPTQAVVSVTSGTTTLTFDTNPAATEWSTITAGFATGTTGATYTNTTQLDAAVAALTQAAVNATLPTSATNPPSSNAAGRYNTTLKLLQSRSTGLGASVLLGRLSNAELLGFTNLTVEYDLTRYSIATAEQIEGFRVYFSTTGLANSWTVVPGLSVGTGGLATTINVSNTFATTGWGAGGNAYLMFVDDNADPGTDDAFSIDNLKLTPTLQTGVQLLKWNLTHGVGGAPNGNFEVSGSTYWNDATNANAPSGFANGGIAAFDQNPATTATITVPADVAPQTLAIQHASGTYDFSGAGKIIAGLLTKTGAGTVRFGSENSFTTVKLNGGVTITDNALALGTAAALSVDGASTLTTTTDLTIAGGISGAGPLTKNGAGALTVTAASAITGTVDVDAGKIIVGNGGGFSNAASTLNIKPGATLEATAPTAVAAIAGNVNFSDTAGTTITVNSPTEVGTTASGLNLTKANGITVAGPTVTKAGLGSLRITTAQTLTNNWVVTGGYLEAAASTALGTGQVTVNSGWLSLTNAQIANAVTLNGGGIGVRSGTVALPTENYTGPITVAGDSFITVRRSSTPTQHNGFFIGGVLSGSGALTFVPPNELTVGAGVPPNITTVAPTGVPNLTAATSTTQGVTQGAVTLLNTGNTYSGNWNITSQQILSALPAGGTGNVFGTSHLTLKGGAVRVLDNGTADNGTLAYNNNVTIDVPSDAVNPGVATILVDRQTFPAGAPVASNPSVQGAFTGNTVQFGTLATAGGLTLKTLGLNGYGLAFSGATTISGTTNATFDTESAPLTLAGGVSGTGGLTKLGAGTLTITGTASYAGNTDVSAGILNVSGVSGGALAISSSQTLSGSGTIAGNINANNGATIAPGNSTGVGILTVGGLTLGVAGSDIANLNFAWNGGTLGSIVVSDPSALIVNGGANTAKLNFSGVSGAVGTHVLIDYNGTALTGGQFSAFKIENLFPRILGNLVNNTIDTRVELNVTGINFPRWSGTQSQEWSTNSIAGSKNWTLTTGGAQTDFITSDKVLFDNLAASKTVDISVADVSPTEVEVNNSGAGNDYTIGGAFGIIGNAPLVKNGSGKVTISNTNGFTGPVTINDGTISVATVTDSTVAGPLGAGNAINIVGGALEFTGLTGSTNRAIVSTAGTVKVDAGNTLTLAGAVSGANFDKSGAGTVILTGANTPTAISVSQGTLQVGDGTAAGSLGTGIITNNATLVFNPPAAGLAIANEIAGTGSINKTGANNLTLGGTTANTFSGLTTISDGTVTAGKTAGINAIGGNLTIEAAGKFIYNGNNVGNQIADTATITVNGGTFGQITASGTNPTNPGAPETVANVIVNSGTFSTGRAAFTATGQVAVHGGEVQSHRGALLTAHSLLIDGTGSVALDGGSATANNEPRLAVGAGGLTLDSGTINFNKQLGAAAAAGSVGTRLVLQGDLTSTGVSSLVQNNTTVASVKAQVDLSGADRTFNVDGVLNLGAVGAGVDIINAGATAAGLIKTGTGNLFLAGANTYNGDTIIQDGTITLTGSVSGSANIDVKTGATLDVSTASGGFVVGVAQTIKGNGLVIGTTTLGGTLSPGSSIGQLDFTNDVTFTNAIAAFEIQKAGVTLTNDKAVIGGALTLAGTLNVASLGGTFAEGDTFDLFDAASFTGTLAMGTMPALDLGLSWDVSNIGVDGSITVIPEPGSVALLVLGSTLLFRRRRNA